jgi:hypothetical protein
LYNSYYTLKDDKWTKKNYKCVKAQLWGDTQVLSDQLFNKTGVKEHKEIIYLDLPELHLNRKMGQRFITALANSNNMKLYEKTAIQILVNQHWEMARLRLVVMEFIPTVA